MTNEYLAAFVDECYQLGVREAVFSPGSRSTALAMLFQEYGKFATYMNIDERSAAFFAFGIAKAQARPVVLVCTSGSAGAHYFPALTEAKHSRVPLMVLTADRPAELRFTGAPQTVDQTRFFGDFVQHYEELSQPTEQNYWRYPRQVAQRAFVASVSQPAGPVQINVPLSEPLVPSLEVTNYSKDRRPFLFIPGRHSASADLSVYDRIVLLAGPDADQDYAQEILDLADRLKAPILADPLSNLRNFDHPAVMDSYDAFLADTQLADTLRADLIIQFGQMPISKRVLRWVAKSAADYFQVDPVADFRNPARTTTQLIQSQVKDFAQSISLEKMDTSYLRAWQTAQELMRTQLNKVESEDLPFEGRYIRELQRLIPNNTQLFISNSMTIRNMDYFWEKKDSGIRVLGNRGVNGIDGTESTALGVSTTGRPTLLLTGDLSMLHDMNGLILGKTHALNLTIVLFNNNGGAIFHYLGQKGQPHFDYLFSTPHDLNFAGLAQLTGLDYRGISGYADFREQVPASLTSPGIHLLEIKTDKDISLSLHKKYLAKES